MQELKLTGSQEQILHDQVIDANQPGSILRDFQMLLDFVGTEGVKAAGKYNLLPIEAIPELNRRLSRPLVWNLQRPQLRSHPYLQGLHLLLRASGLSRVEGAGAEARLRLEAQALESWRRLNACEQYFTLLEAWLLIARPEMAGERAGRGDIPLGDAILTWRGIPARGVKFAVGQPQDLYHYGLGGRRYHAALMDLFGLLALEHPRQAVQPWHPAGVKRVPFGDAVLTLLGEWYWGDEGFVRLLHEGASTGAIHFGRWQELFQPYFPKWRENLVLPEIEVCKDIFLFCVSLGKIWRRIAIAGDSVLDRLARAILDSVRFDDDHLYEFTYVNRLGAPERVHHPFCEEGPCTDEVRVGELPLQPGQSMTFLFDFGDAWRFDVQLEGIEPRGKGRKLPRIVEKHGKSPEQYPDAEW